MGKLSLVMAFFALLILSLAAAFCRGAELPAALQAIGATQEDVLTTEQAERIRGQGHPLSGITGQQAVDFIGRVGGWIADRIGDFTGLRQCTVASPGQPSQTIRVPCRQVGR